MLRILATKRGKCGLFGIGILAGAEIGWREEEMGS